MDSSNAIIAKVSLVLTQRDTGQVTTLKPDADGLATFQPHEIAVVNYK